MSETTTVTLTDFLLARIAEDEEYSRAEIKRRLAQMHVNISKFGHGWADTGSLNRLLAECEVKRRIVELHTMSGEHEPGHIPGRFCEACADWSRENDEGQPPTVPWPCPTLRLVAVVYADHRGYRDEWRPVNMNSETCSTCRHWTPPRGRTDYKNIWQESDADMSYGKCEAIMLGDSYENAPTPLPLAVTKDGSDFKADLFTRAEFGCVLHNNESPA